MKDKPIRFSEQQLDMIRADYLNDIRISIIAKQLGCSHTTVRKAIKAMNLTTRNHKRKYSCDEDYFMSIDSPCKAYWLGFIAADGNLVKGKQKILAFTLSSEDEERLHTLQQSLKSTYPIHRYNYKTPVSILRIESTKLWDSLNNLGITPAKTFTIKFPTLPVEFVRDYIRGYLDGDGCICNSERNKQIAFVGTYDMLDRIRIELPFSHDVKVRMKASSKADKVYTLHVRLNRERAIALYSYLYNGACTYMPRKKRILETIVQNYNATH